MLDDLLLLARQEQAGLGGGPLVNAELQAFDLLELSPDPTCHSVPRPTQDRERVFERFWRGADRGGHSGLGLAIGRAIARRHELVVALPAMDGR